MRPEEVSELSRLLDAALALDPTERATWLAELEKTQPETANHLRSMLAQTQATDTSLLPRLPELDSDDAVASAGERIGPYQLIREIGRGGMGSVWLAERVDGAFKRRVALKLPRLTWSAGLAKRMARERDVGALLEHPNIARLYDAGIDEHGRPYIAYEYIEGRPLDVYCRDHVLDLRARLKLFAQVVRAVAFAHSRLVLHRDIKPSNVLVDAEGNVHLLDFGIAKLLDETASDVTQEQGRLMTLSYAAPEQILGRPLSVAADVYSLGVVLYELLAGTLPHSGRRSTAAALEEAILAGDAPLASSRVTDRRLAHDLRGDLDAIVGKALKPDPNERYPTADALAVDLQHYLDGQPITARPDSAWYRLRKAVVRHRLPVAAVSSVLVVALLGAGATWMQGRKTAAEAERTRLATAFVSELFRMNALQEPPRGDTTAAGTKPLVDRGVELIEAKFQSQPDLQAELYGAIGRVYFELGIDRKAMIYAAQQLSSLRAQNADNVKIAGALILLAQAALTADKEVDAEAHLRQAIVLLPVSETLTPDALALLARALMYQGKMEETTQTLQEGQRILAAQKRPKSSAGAWLKFTQGQLLAIANRFNEAKPLFDAAVAEAIEAEGPASPTAARVQRILGAMLMELDHLDEGREYARRAIAALEQAGGPHRVRGSLAKADAQLREYAQSNATFEETIAVLDEVSQFLRSTSSGAPPESLAEFDFMRARALMIRGDYESACPLAEASKALVLEGTQSMYKEFLLTTPLGDCAMNLGSHDAADKYFRRALMLRNEMGGDHHPWAAIQWADIAFNLSMAGRHQEAEAFLGGAPKFETGQGTIYETERVIPETLSRLRMNAGDVERARALLPDSERHPKYADNSRVFSFYELRGEIRCASGDHAAGLSDLQRSIDSQMVTSGPNHPWLARTRAVAGLCALAQGNRKMAEELAKESRQAFIAQPAVSPYFKEPLKRLERQLGRKPS